MGLEYHFTFGYIDDTNTTDEIHCCLRSNYSYSAVRSHLCYSAELFVTSKLSHLSVQHLLQGINQDIEDRKFQHILPRIFTDDLSIEKGSLVFIIHFPINHGRPCLFTACNELQPPYGLPYMNSSLWAVSNLLIQFTTLSNKLTQGYVGCILQGVASFQRVNDTKSYRAHCLFPKIQKKSSKLIDCQMRTNVCE